MLLDVTEGDHAGEVASSIYGTERPPSPGNRLGRALGGLRGNPVMPGEKINVEPFIGKPYLIQVEKAPGGNGTRISTIMPAI